MADRVDPIPKGYHTITPDMVIKGASEAIEFYKKAFGAKERSCMMGPDGRSVLHAEIQIGDSVVMLADENPQYPRRSPTLLKGTAVTLHLYVEDADGTFKRALGAGAKQVMAVEKTFWGDRYGVITDPFGHMWSIASHVEDVPMEEMMTRMQAAMGTR
jgi:uncharacterized glyoxalase superfamily protein PhnB